MKKCLITTIADNNNYGNRLQNYALEKVLEKYNIKAYTLWDKRLHNYKTKIKFLIESFFPHSKTNLKRMYRFKKFTEKYTNPYFSKPSNFFDDYYDFYSIGSDQIFNDGLMCYLKFLIELENPIFTYAPSLGTSDRNLRNQEIYIELSKKIKHLSVREDSGKEILEDLTGRKDIEVLIDPTLLITTEEWNNIIRKPKMLKTDKYILIYFLGEISKSRRKEIERIAQENNCEIIDIMDSKSKFYTCDPAEFLYLEKNAFLVCTDSFHSSIFAFLYNRPFVIFEREDKRANMNSRLENLIKKFKLKNRNYNEKEITKENLNHDYSEAYKILEQERKKSEEFLRAALDIKDSE